MNAKLNLNSVPEDLKELIRIIVLNFYGFDFYLCTEYLMIYLCLRQDILAEMLKLEPKIVNEHLNRLKKDKFLNEKLMVDIQRDGKRIKHHFFYINFKSAVNVIKYKIDKIRERIENDQLKSTQTIYRCVNCNKMFTELDLKDFFLTMKCSRCFGEIHEEIHQFRNLLQTFNTKMSRVFELLKKVEKIKLPLFVTRPMAFNEQQINDKLVLREKLNELKEENLIRKEIELSNVKNLSTKSEKDLEKNILAKLFKHEYKKIKINDGKIIYF